MNSIFDGSVYFPKKVKFLTGGENSDVGAGVSLGSERSPDRLRLVEVGEVVHVDVDTTHVVALSFQEVVELGAVGVAQDAQVLAVAALAVVDDSW